MDQRSGASGIHVVEIGGTALKEIVNLVANGVVPERAVVATDFSTGRPVLVWVDSEADGPEQW